MAAAAPLSALWFLGGLLLGVGVVAILAVTARRLLGLHAGWPRTIAAGAIGYTIAALVSQAWDGSEEPAVLITVLIGISLLVAMIVLVIAEAAVPSGPGTRPWQALRRAAGRGLRYSQISAIAVRHGLGPYLSGRIPRRDRPDARALGATLREALEQAGVAFVKLGQLLSTRPDLVPPEVAEELAALQEQATPAPWPEIRDQIHAELGERRAELEELDPEPLAAASIAQVHEARLRTGERVVVKVQRPGIRPEVERDLEVVRRIAATVEARQRRGAAGMEALESPNTLNAVELADGFADAIREELDFRVEARNIASVRAAANGGASQVRLPIVHEELSGASVLVLDHIDGTPLGSAAAELDRTADDRRSLARELLRTVLTQILVDGVFHADPHPGNVFVLDEGGLALLDFGSVGRLDPLTRGVLRDLLWGIDRDDPEAVGEALLELAGSPDEVDRRELTLALGRFMSRHLGPGAPPGVAFADLLRIVAARGLSVPPEVAGVFRALATLEGTLRQLDPGFDLVSESRAFATERFGLASAPETIEEELRAALPAIRRLPRRVDRISGALEQGRLQLNVRLLADERDRRYVSALVHQALLAFLGAATGIMAVLLMSADGGPVVSGSMTLFQLLGYNLLVVSFVLVLRVLFLVLRTPRG